MSNSKGDHFEMRMPWKTLEIPVCYRKFSRGKIILLVEDIKYYNYIFYFLPTAPTFLKFSMARSLVQWPPLNSVHEIWELELGKKCIFIQI